MLTHTTAYLVDVGQRALAGKLDCIHLHRGACLNDLIFVTQGSHIEHEGLSGPDELIVHLAHERPEHKDRNTHVTQYLFSWKGES